ncbi:hypothetical protein [Adhaeribacter radiodurans]|uniref:DUF3052 domain-containing protein n=1 Tax=Adhaeribacter radiodurans TaxID=2745197 RepID=A0A7L7L5S0_9BACT|nr:hypothetical protein [Adhaeribacter radiodurans]QMU27729.1 hypothetical protein HUW48_06570 [Adhaeribacter radiodurans]
MNSEAIFKKLRLSPNQKILILNAPDEFAELLTEIHHDQQFSPEDKGTYDFVAVFSSSQSEMEHLTQSVAHAGKYDCLFWACYPKGTGKIKSDLKRNTIWNIIQQIDLRCVTQVALDETWSGLRARPHAAVGK